MTQAFHFEEGRLWIENYDQKKPFASFLPGIAGKYGIPMWVYYVNRAQLISSFGLESKDHAMLDFSPANLAYRRTETDGFRTWLKIDNYLIEPFQQESKHPRRMFIDQNMIGIEENINDLLIRVSYFNIVEKPYPGLVRKVELINRGKKSKSIELVDGLSTIWPFGTGSYMTKNMSNLAVAWFDVFNIEEKMPFFKNRSTTEDSAEVDKVEAGHFYFSVGENNQKLDVIYDPSLLFDYDLGLKKPARFADYHLNQLLGEEQIKVNQLMSAFSAVSIKLEDHYTFYTLYGKANHMDELESLSHELNFEEFVRLEKRQQSLIKEITAPMQVKTNYPLFDSYMKQNFLDNLLRGGYPLVLKGKEEPIIYHIYSRIHGDMEREYNHFFVEPAYFSHGNGSYRDVNQNRRNDIYFVPEAARFNIRQFMDLIQMDGHNPLTIKGSRLVIQKEDIDDILKYVLSNQKIVKDVISKPFTPGELMTKIDHLYVDLTVSKDVFLDIVSNHSVQQIESVYGTGYWSDHFIYNMDLIDAYLNVFPDQLDELFFKGKYRFYQSHVSVYPRKVKYVLTPSNEVKQLGALYNDDEKVKETKLKVEQTNFHQTSDFKEVEVDFFTKMIHLVTIKFSSLDPYFIGIMMDSEKPGWNDAMNGLPAIFGSGVTESITLKRYVEFLINSIHKLNRESFVIPKLLLKFFSDVVKSIPKGFDEMQDVREKFVKETNNFFDQTLDKISTSELMDHLKQMNDVLNAGIKKAKEIGKGLIPTYLSYEPKSYALTGDSHPDLGYPTVKVSSWGVRMLPHYLEAPATLLKVTKNKNEAKEIYDFVKKSEMYDQKLKLYKTSTDLEDETLAIGRARAFTKGWLERESNFMHMAYKYLIGTFKSGLYEDFYEDIKTMMPPFMDPEVYGRSPLENSSFIATSNNPNPKNHGRGFVARLTGTTSEAMTLLLLMMTGEHLFTYENHELRFHIEPKLDASFFDSNNEVSFTLFENIKITIKNPLGANTYENIYPVEYVLINQMEIIRVSASYVSGELAKRIRDKDFAQIVVTVSSNPIVKN